MAPQKANMAAAAISNFGKNVNNSRLDKDICTKFYGKMHHGHAEMDNHVTKSRNRKLIRVASSNKSLKDKCADLSDYNRYLNQMWHRTQIPQYQHAEMAKFT